MTPILLIQGGALLVTVIATNITVSRADSVQLGSGDHTTQTTLSPRYILLAFIILVMIVSFLLPSLFPRDVANDLTLNIATEFLGAAIFFYFVWFRFPDLLALMFAIGGIPSLQFAAAVGADDPVALDAAVNVFSEVLGAILLFYLLDSLEPFKKRLKAQGDHETHDGGGEESKEKPERHGPKWHQRVFFIIVLLMLSIFWFAGTIGGIVEFVTQSRDELLVLPGHGVVVAIVLLIIFGLGIWSRIRQKGDSPEIHKAKLTILGAVGVGFLIASLFITSGPAVLLNLGTEFWGVLLVGALRYPELRDWLPGNLPARMATFLRLENLPKGREMSEFLQRFKPEFIGLIALALLAPYGLGLVAWLQQQVPGLLTDWGLDISVNLTTEFLSALLTVLLICRLVGCTAEDRLDSSDAPELSARLTTSVRLMFAAFAIFVAKPTSSLTEVDPVPESDKILAILTALAFFLGVFIVMVPISSWSSRIRAGKTGQLNTSQIQENTRWLKAFSLIAATAGYAVLIVKLMA